MGQLKATQPASVDAVESWPKWNHLNENVKLNICIDCFLTCGTIIRCNRQSHAQSFVVANVWTVMIVKGFGEEAIQLLGHYMPSLDGLV